MTDHTDRRDPPRRRTGLAVAAAAAALGLGALGAAAAGAFADATGSTGSAGGASTTLVQDGTTTPQQPAPDRGDCPGEGGASQGGGSEDGGDQGSSTTPS